MGGECLSQSLPNFAVSIQLTGKTSNTGFSMQIATTPNQSSYDVVIIGGAMMGASVA